MPVSEINEIALQDLSTQLSEQTSLSPTEEKTNEVAQEIFLNPHRTIDPGKEAILAGAEFEKKSSQQLKVMEDKSNEIIRSIDLLLDLSREAGKLNAEKPKLNDTFISLIQQLKERDINLIDLPAGNEIDKEQLAALKSSLGSHLDKLRTEVQQIFTKMQTVIQNMSSVNDSIKKMISEQSDLIRKIQERSLKR